MFRATALFLACLAPQLLAQQPCGSSPTVFLTATPAVLGQVVTVTWGSPGDPGAMTALAVSDSPAPSNVGGVGTICLDTTSSAFQIVHVGLLDATGRASLAVSLPNIPSLTTNPPVFAIAAVFRPGGTIPTRTIRLEFENGDAYKRTVSMMVTPRGNHTATALHADPESPDNRVFVAGGSTAAVVSTFTMTTLFDPSATDSTEIYDPLTRTFSPGPQLLTPRSHHRAVRMQDGRILIIGGVDQTDVSLASCEIFDPMTDTISGAASMTTPRALPEATLLNDGRVLVTGGVPTFVGTFTSILNASIITAELYDPATDTWALAANVMNLNRVFHTQELLPDGRVLIIAGVYAAQGSSYVAAGGVSAPVCNYFDPTTDLFSWAPTCSTMFTVSPQMGQASAIDSVGNVYVTGGPGCEDVFFLALGSNSWVSISPLDGFNYAERTFHEQVPLRNGAIMLYRGYFYTGTSAVRFQYFSTQWTGAAIATNPGISGQTLNSTDPGKWSTFTELYDGTWIEMGGMRGIPGTFILSAPTAGAWMYTP